jgi:hypothetical protein
VELNWETSSELNNDYFTIERSDDAKNWTEVEVIQGHGNSTTSNIYAVFDNTHFDGVVYYRLKQTDFDGGYKYSYIVSVNKEKEHKLNVGIYPKPVNDILFINKIPEGNVTLSLIDVLGNTLYKNDLSKSYMTFVMSVYPQGMYFIKVSNQTENYTVKIQKQ